MTILLWLLACLGYFAGWFGTSVLALRKFTYSYSNYDYDRGKYVDQRLPYPLWQAVLVSLVWPIALCIYGVRVAADHETKRVRTDRDIERLEKELGI